MHWISYIGGSTPTTLARLSIGVKDSVRYYFIFHFVTSGLKAKITIYIFLIRQNHSSSLFSDCLSDRCPAHHRKDIIVNKDQEKW